MCIGLSAGLSHHEQANVIARLPTTTRAAIVARAESLANHPWTCGATNLHASCSTKYQSDWKSGQHVVGIPYRWGGADSPDEFEQKLAKGLAAGSHSRYGVLSCAAGEESSVFLALCLGFP